MNTTPAAGSVNTAAPITSDGVRLDEVMTLHDWDATGVARLRPDERTALQSWMQRYHDMLLDSVSKTATHAIALGNESAGEVATAAPPAPAPSAYALTAPAPSVPAAPNGPTSWTPTTTAPQQPAGVSYAPGTGAATQPTVTAPPPPAAQYQQPAAAPPYQQQPAAPYQPPTTSAAPAPAPAVQPSAYGQPAAQYTPQVQPAAAPPMAAAPSSAPPAPVVPYPTAPTAPAPQQAPVQQLAPAFPGQAYSVTAAPAPSPGPAGAVVRTGLSVRNVLVGNRFVSLTDGSMWDIYPADRAEAGVWHTSDPVYVRLATSTVTGGYDRELVNASRNVLVRARFAGQVSMGQ